MALYWLPDFSGTTHRVLADTDDIIPALKRAIDFYIHSPLVDAYPGDDSELATLLAALGGMNELPPQRRRNPLR